MNFEFDCGSIADAHKIKATIEYLLIALNRGGSIRLLKEFSEGFTQTRVLLAEEQRSPNDPQPFRFVLKVGPATLLRDEVIRYHKFIPHARAHAAFARLIEPTPQSIEGTLATLPEGNLPGAIAYDYAPAALARTDCISLKSLVRRAVLDDASIEEAETVIDVTMNALGSLYAESKKVFTFNVTTYYLERWAPDFELTVERCVPVAGTLLLTLDRLSADHFAREPASSSDELRRVAELPQIEVKRDITIHHAVLAGQSTTHLKFYAPKADTLSVSINIERLPDHARQVIAAAGKAGRFGIWGTVGRSRYDFYRSRLNEVLPRYCDLGKSLITIGAVTLHNPLAYLSRLFKTAAGVSGGTLVAPAHGDLHPGNVLVVGTNPVIIDYGLSDTSLPVGVDAARLFGGLVRDVVADLLSPEDLVIVLSQVLELCPPTPLSDQKANRAYRLLRKLADGAQRITDEDTAALWPIHVYGYSWISLKWDDGSSSAYAASLLLAAVALTKLIGVPERDTTSLPESPELQAPKLSTLHKERVIKPEGPAEILLLVCQFSGHADYDPTDRIYSALADNVFESIPGLARVERMNQVVSARKDAIDLSNRYKASMVVWGTYDNLGISPRYEITRDSLIFKRSMIQLDQATRYQLGERFESYITQDLGAELTFLSLVAIGHMCLLNLNYTEALKVFERALQLISDREQLRRLGGFDVYYSLAAIFITLNHYNDASDSNEKARELDPTDFRGQLQHLVIRSLREKVSGEQMLDNLRQLLRERIQNEPEENEGIKKTLKILEGIKTLAGMRKLFESSVEKMRVPLVRESQGKKYSRDVVVHLQRAHDYCMAGGQYSKALREVRAALRVSPRSPDVLLFRAQYLALLDKVPEALRDLDAVLKISPSDTRAHVLRANIFCDSGDPQRALEEIELAFAKGFSKAHALEQWGNIMLALGRGAEVMQAIRDWEVDPSNPGIFGLRSKYYRQEGAYPLALANANEYVRLEKENPHAAYTERARVYAGMERNEEALSDLQRALPLIDADSFARKVLVAELSKIENRIARDGRATMATSVEQRDKAG